MSSQADLFINALPQLLAALVGGGVAGFFAIRGVKRAIDADRLAQKEAENREICGVLAALYHETETVWIRYMNTAGKYLESLEHGQILDMFYPVYNDYFTFFHANASVIGRIPNSGIRKAIVHTYTMGKGLVDSYKMNNSMLEDLNALSTRSIDGAADGAVLQMIERKKQILAEYAIAIRETHDELNSEVTNLLKALQPYLPDDEQVELPS